MKKKFFILIVLAIVLAEILLIFNKLLGFLLYAAIIGLALYDLEEYEHLVESDKLLVFLLIVPIARISEFFVNFSFFTEAFIFYGIITCLVIFYTKKFKINPGYRLKYTWFVIHVVIIGILIGYIGNLAFNIEKSFELLFLIPFIAFSEEILFRGMIQNTIKTLYGSFAAITLTSLLFGIFSLGFGFRFAYFMFIASLVMCLIYNKTENIWLTVIINFLMNLLIFVPVY